MKFNNLERKEIQKKLKILMVLRIALITLFLVSSILFQIRFANREVPAFYLLVVSVYFITIIYALLINRVENLKLFAYIQLIGDLIIESVLVYITGGIESSFSFTYIISIFTIFIITLFGFH